MTEQMRVALGQHSSATDEYLTFAKQLGVGGVQLNKIGKGIDMIPEELDLPDDKGYWEANDLRGLKQRVNDYQLELEAIENVPRHFYLDAMLGGPRRDEQIGNYQTLVRNMGEAGIPILGLNWMPNLVWRTPEAIGRGGVKVTAFDMARALAGEVVVGITEVPEAEDREYSENEIFDNYVYFMQRVLPVAEEAGVKIALHPDDPPVESLGGIGRVFYKPENFKRALEAAPSPNHGLDFCMGCFSEMVYAEKATTRACWRRSAISASVTRSSMCTSAMYRAACRDSRSASRARAMSMWLQRSGRSKRLASPALSSTIMCRR